MTQRFTAALERLVRAAPGAVLLAAPPLEAPAGQAQDRRREPAKPRCRIRLLLRQFLAENHAAGMRGKGLCVDRGTCDLDLENRRRRRDRLADRLAGGPVPRPLPAASAINIVFFVLSLSALVGLELVARRLNPDIFREYFDRTDAWNGAVRPPVVFDAGDALAAGHALDRAFGRGTLARRSGGVVPHPVDGHVRYRLFFLPHSRAMSDPANDEPADAEARAQSYDSLLDRRGQAVP